MALEEAQDDLQIFSIKPENFVDILMSQNQKKNLKKTNEFRKMIVCSFRMKLLDKKHDSEDIC